MQLTYKKKIDIFVIKRKLKQRNKFEIPGNGAKNF